MAAVQTGELQERLVDLGQFGIHITNREGVCYKCGKIIDKKWSSGIGADARCEDCLRKDSNHGDNAVYSPETVFVLKTLDQRLAQERYNAIVKIDGQLYEARYMHGNSFDLNNLATGETVRMFALSMSPYNLKEWYRAQPVTTTPAYVIQFFWPQIKDQVSEEVHQRANWLAGQIPFYDIGHSGRGIEREGRVFVRLYVSPSSHGSERDLDLLDVQLVKQGNEPYLDQYEVTTFGQDIAILRWGQAGLKLTEALLMVPSGRVKRSYERAMEYIRELREHNHILPSDMWITMLLRRCSFLGSNQHPVSELSHLIMLPIR